MPAALERLKKRSEFLAVAATNRRWTTPGLVLQVRPVQADVADMPRAAGLRVGFTATKKIGNAVTRNRARRRLRAAVDEILRGRTEGVTPADLVVVARPGTLTRPYCDLKADLSLSLRRLNVLK